MTERSTRQHLHDVNMSYTQHLFHAWGMAFALLVHGMFPTVYTTYVSDQIKGLDTTH